MMVRKACLEISLKKFLKRKVEAEQARAMIVCEVWFSISKKYELPSNLKI